jgi:hypothetical protein
MSVATLIFAVNQKVTKIEILDENDRRGVVNNILEPFFALAQRLLRPVALGILRVQRFVGSFKLLNCSVQFVARVSKRLRRDSLRGA